MSLGGVVVVGWWWLEMKAVAVHIPHDVATADRVVIVGEFRG